MSLNKKENKELIVRDIEEKFSELLDLKFNEVEFTDKFVKKIEEIFKENDIFRISYKCAMDYARYLAEFCNEIYSKTKVCTYEPLLTCTLSFEKGKYQYAVNELVVLKRVLSAILDKFINAIIQ